MPNTHLLLQGKGGVGKSVVASILAQWLSSVKRAPLCLDTDPTNRTFAAYKALHVEPLEILEDDDINPRRFDDLIERVATSASDVVVDNGASSFVALSKYLVSNDVPGLLAELEHPLIIHVLITGGQALHDTLHGFAQMARQFPEPIEFVLWLNPFWGPVEQDGKHFEEMRVFTECKDRVRALLKIPQLKAETYGTDFSKLLSSRLTFAEALAAPERTIMERQRLKVIRDVFFKQLESAAL